MAERYSWPRRKFEGFLAPASDGSKASLYYLFVAAFVFSVVILFSAFFLHGSTSGGVFGDFIGGTLNPILTFITFMAVLITIVLQQTELKETREELAKSAGALEGQVKSLDRQNFEATFFQMLQLHNSIVNSMERPHGAQLMSRGREYIKKTFTDSFDHYYANLQGTNAFRVMEAHKNLMVNDGANFTHYTRYLFSMIRFVDESAVDKPRYMRLLRDQLSDYELLYLFYAAMVGKLGHWWHYINRYSLLAHLPIEKLLSDEDRKFFVDQGFDLDLLEPEVTD